MPTRASESAAPDAAPPDSATPQIACQFPISLVANRAVTDYEQSIWQIFLAANCGAPNPQYGPLVWENWSEQGCLIGSDTCSQSTNTPGTAAAPVKRRRRLHTSGLLQARTTKRRLSLAASNPFAIDCAGQPYCEEVTVSPPELAFISPNLLTSSGQYAFGQNTTTTPPISMPPGAVEVKVGWGLLAAGACQPSTTLHVETFLDNKNQPQCYAIVGMHVSSKLLPNWVWGTFEPQDIATNPARCAPPTATGIPKATTPNATPSGQYGPCSDAWGSQVAPSSTAAPTAPTAALAALLGLEGANLASEFKNYRLDGVQTDFGTVSTPTLLGNSRVEGAAGVPSGKSSCITCHSNAMVLKTGGNVRENDFTNAMLSGVGPGATIPGGAYQLDFSWMLDFTQK